MADFLMTHITAAFTMVATTTLRQEQRDALDAMAATAAAFLTMVLMAEANMSADIAMVAVTTLWQEQL